MQDRKIRLSQTLSGRRFILTYFKTAPLRMFGFLFFRGDDLTYFAPKRANLDPKVTLSYLDRIVKLVIFFSSISLRVATD